MFKRHAINTKRVSILNSTYVGIAGFMLAALVSGASDNSSVIVRAPNGQTPPTSISTSNNTKRKYVGTKRCRMCHSDHYASWNKLAKADSFSALKPGRSANIKRNAGLDVQRDYTTDTNCLACHAVGFGEPGGYEIPDPNSGRSKRKAAAREGVGCESCHGPGSDFIVVMQSLATTGRSYHPSELAPLGRHPVTKQTCQRCHNAHATCMIGASKKPNTEKSLEWMNVDLGDHHGYHAAIELKQRVKKTDSGEASRSNGSSK